MTFQTLTTAFLSLHPGPEPVLVFQTVEDAARFQYYKRQGRIYTDTNPTWVYLPMPEGLLRVRTAAKGDVAFEFSSVGEQRRFNESIGNLGKVLSNTRDKPHWDRTLYLGRTKVK